MIARIPVLTALSILSSTAIGVCPLPIPDKLGEPVEAAKKVTPNIFRSFDPDSLAPKIKALNSQDKAHYVTDLAKGPTGKKYERAIALTFTVAQQEGTSSLLRYMIDYDGDGYSVVRILAHDIDVKDDYKYLVQKIRDLRPFESENSDDKKLVQDILNTFPSESENSKAGIKLLSDVDDTIYANLVDPRYEKKTGKRYPGVKALYRAIATEPDEIIERFPDSVALVTLSARPETRGTDHPVKKSLQSVSDLFDGDVCAMSLGGELLSSALGTLFTFINQGKLQTKSQQARRLSVYEKSDAVKDLSSDDMGFLADQETEIGRVKFSNYKRFAMVYPRYDYIFFGDSGQADAYAAQLIMEHNNQLSGSGRAIITFIHDLRVDGDKGERRGMSPTKFVQEAVKRKDVVLFRNHIQAALIAFQRGVADEIDKIVDAEELLDVVREALTELPEARFKTDAIAKTVKAQFANDAAMSILAVRGAGKEVPEEVFGLVTRTCGLYGGCPVLH